MSGELLYCMRLSCCSAVPSEAHDDPVLFALRDWVSLATGVVAAVIVELAV